MTKDDVQNVVFVINPASSPGLTSMNWLFLQKYCNSDGDCVTKEVQNFIDNGCPS